VSSADLGWRNGVWVANGNLAIRHLGIPTVTVPMGTMDDTGSGRFRALRYRAAPSAPRFSAVSDRDSPRDRRRQCHRPRLFADCAREARSNVRAHLVRVSICLTWLSKTVVDEMTGSAGLIHMPLARTGPADYATP
jgi:hypothetical protein